MLPAARFGDFHACPAPTHGGGPVIALPTARVLTNSRAQARGTDLAACAGPADFIVTGAATVKVGGQPAARLSDKTMHGGVVAVGAGNVMIGGPTAGVTLGDPAAAAKDCAALADTRHTPGRRGQSYGNCGIEAWRAIINRQRAADGLPPLTEDDAMQRALELGVAGHDPAKPWAYGATSADGRVKLLQDQGVDASAEPGSSAAVQQAVAERRGVSASVYPYWYWPGWTGVQPDAQHEIQITGVEFDENGNVKAYIISDSGLGQCSLRVSASDFVYAQIPGAPITVTKQPVR
jgi:uncharacterized Zn-binding protein involved in type VI secretion